MNRMRRFLQMMSATLALAVLSVAGFGPAAASALSSAAANDVCGSINQVGNNSDCSVDSSGKISNSSTSDGVTGIISGAVSILSYIAGVVAIIMILIAGFRYMTSGGDSNKVSSAKSALIYAIIGIVVAALAQVIVHFALSSANSAANDTPATNSSSGGSGGTGLTGSQTGGSGGNSGLTGSSGSGGNSEGGLGHPNLQ